VGCGSGGGIGELEESDRRTNESIGIFGVGMTDTRKRRLLTLQSVESKEQWNSWREEVPIYVCVSCCWNTKNRWLANSTQYIESHGFIGVIREADCHSFQTNI
jgi:hypothetical protein